VRNEQARGDEATARSAMTVPERAAIDAGFFAPRPPPAEPGKPAQPMPPTQARSGALSRFDELSAAFGLSPKAAQRVREQAGQMPADEVPGFLARVTEAFNKRGLFRKPVDADAATALGQALDGPPPEAAAPVEAPAAAQAAAPAAAPAPAEALPAADVLADAPAYAPAEDDFTGLASAGPVIAGETINRNWTAFAPESGTLNIPRDQMPQVKAEHRGALVQFLGARGIAHEADEVDPNTLKPTQAEFSPRKVKQATEYTGGNRSILVSADGHIIDGHHQWLAAVEKSEPIKVIRLDAPAQDLLRLTHQFPSSTTATGPRKASNEPIGDLAGTAGGPAAAGAGRAPDAVGSSVDVGRVPADAAGGDAIAPGGVAPSGVEAVPAGTGSEPDEALTPAAGTAPAPSTTDQAAAPGGVTPTATPTPAPAPGAAAPTLSVGDTFTLDGKSYTATKASPTSVTLADEAGKKRVVASNGKTWQTLLEQKTRAATPPQATEAAGTQAPAAPGEAAAPTGPAAGAQPAEVEAGGVAPAKPAKPQVFKTRKAAEEAKTGNTQRLRKVKGGYILRAATDKELEAADRAGRRLAGKQSVDVENDTLTAAIAKLGGLAMSERADTVGKGNKNAGGRMLFTQTGRAVDEIADDLRILGYVPQAEMDRDGGTTWLRDAIRAEFDGLRTFNSEAGTEWIEEAQRRYEDQMGDPSEDALADFTPDDLDDAGYTGASPEVQRATDELLAAAEALGIETEALREDAARMTADAAEDAYHAEVQRLAREAIAAARQDAARPDAEAARGSDTDRVEADGQAGDAAEGLTLEAQTAEDLQAKAEREDAAKAAEAAEQKRLADKATADAQRDEFTLTGSDRPADVAAAAGQGGLFDGAAESPAPAPTSAPAKPLTDAGEELIRNRRGKLKGLAWADVSSMNDTLKVAQVVKTNVWPRPDYTKLVEDGAPAWKAAALKVVYDKIAAAPVTRAAPTDADLKDYIETLAAIREHLTAELDRVESSGGTAADLWKTLEGSNVFGKVFPLPADARAVYGRPSPFDRSSEQGKANNRRALLIGGNGAVQALQFGYRTTSKIKDLLAEGFPAKQEAWQKSYEVRSLETRDSDVPADERTGQPQTRFFVYEKGSRWRLANGGQDGGYATQEQAEAFARTLVARKKEVLPPSRGLDLADATRTGPDWRNGRDVTAQEIMDRFGFRGVNLGEYVKAKQAVAQAHMNHVYDAFSDLADLLGVPPKAMSLNGTLGVAVGAQGSGKALAHFVPGVNEINITRDSGAGALAHEFGHALDHYFAAQHGRATSMAKRPYLSAAIGGLGDPGGVRAEVIDAMRRVMKTIDSRPMTEAEAKKYMADQRELNQRRMDRWVKEFSGNKGADKAALAAVAEKIKRGELGEAPDGDIEANLAEFMRAAGLKPGNAIAANAFTLAYRLRDLADEARFMATHIPQVDTDYAMASKAMDAKKQGDGYWSTPWEKFARAFETYVMDALSDRQRESLYLSGLVDGEGWRDWAESTGKSIPYPAGDERLAMQQAFQAMVDTIQTREDDAGNVAMFRRGDLTPRQRTERVQEVVDLITGTWAAPPTVKVVWDLQDPAVDERIRAEDSRQRRNGAAGTPQAVYFRDTVYIVSSVASSPEDVARSLFHESLGHAGLRAAFGDALTPMLRQMAALNRPAVAAKAKEYGLNMADDADRLRAAEEVLAELAETRPESSWVKRAIAAIRTWLREKLPGMFGDMEMSDAELIRTFIVPARRAIEQGRADKREDSRPKFQRVWHGTPHRGIERFSTDAIGTGEGAQAYGWGLYFASKKEVADHYRRALSSGYAPTIIKNGVELSAAADIAEAYYKVGRVFRGYGSTDVVLDFDRQGPYQWSVKVQEVDPEGEPVYGRRPRWHSTMPEIRDLERVLKPEGYELRRGQLYEVEIPEDSEMLLWDRPLSEQSEKVRDALQRVLQTADASTKQTWADYSAEWKKGGKMAYSILSTSETDNLGGEDGERTSKALLAAGIKGIKYLDGSSRSDGDGSYNYVVFDGADTEIAGVMFSRKPTHTPEQTEALKRAGIGWTMPEGTRFDNYVYKFQDKQIDLRRARDAIKAERNALEDRWDAYLQEELFHGRAAKRTHDFVADELEPLMRDMAARQISIDDLDLYLHARHAEEANKLIAERNKREDEGQTDIDGNVIESPLQDGGSGMLTADARAYLDGLDAAQRQRLEVVAAKVDAIIAKTRDTYASYGLESKATVDTWEQMFDHYVPLMREDHDGGMGIGQGFSIKGRETKHRTGSTAKVVDILANIAMQRERAIVRGEKNRVAVALAGLVKLNPAPDLWSVDKVPTERVLNEATGKVEERQVPGFKSRPNVLVAKIVDKDGNVQERAVVFNDSNERAMRMVTALKNLDATQLEGVLGLSAKVTRYFAAINTQYNPVFGFVNLIRDVQGAALNLTSTPLADHRSDVVKNIAPALRAIYRDERGKSATNEEMLRLWDEMQREGGMTGFRDLYRTSNDRVEAMRYAMDPTSWMNSTMGRLFTAGGVLKVPLSTAQKGAGKMFDWLSDYNLAMEGATRLAAYKVALEQGLSKQQAASIAKNLTVNFNRKGQAGMQMGALYAFFNASVQGTARMGEVLFDTKGGTTLKLTKAGRSIIAGGILLGSIQALALAAAGFDDDEPPDFVRERSLIIPIGWATGKRDYLTVPMPLGWHVLPNIGRTITEYVMSGFKEPGKRAAKLLSTFAEAFNPIGGAGWSLQTLSPTALDPVVAIAENRDWTGKPIARQSFDPVTPGHAMAKDTASSPAKWISEALNWATGGTKHVAGALSPTPDQIDYLLGQVTGGVGRELGKLEQTATAGVTGEELPPHKIPLVGRFYGNADGPSGQATRFYETLNRMAEHEAQLKGMAKEFDEAKTPAERAEIKAEVKAYKADHPEWALFQSANSLERVVRELRQKKREMLKAGDSRARIKAVEEKITAVMTKMNEAAERAASEQGVPQD
jgi:hypothetical protein